LQRRFTTLYPSTCERNMEHVQQRRTLTIILAAGTIVLTLLALLAWKVLRQPTASEAATSEQRRIMIAVLPFENLGPPGDEYFADGITEEISGRLSTVSELGVISRTSTRQYKASGMPVKDIARELGADYVLEGTVRWDRSADINRVLITPQLVRAADDVYVWSDRYDQVLDDLFQAQSEIASRVIEQLDLTLLAATRERIESRPTESFEAYQAYLRGLESVRSADYNEDSWRLGLSMFERAVNLDPDFALAHAEASRLHSRAYHLGFDRTPHRLALAKAAADRAAELDPDLNETRLATAYFYYWGLKDYENALAELDAVERATRNNPLFLEARGYILRRQGRSASAAESLIHAFELSPRDPSLAVEIANTHLGMWRFERARHYYDLAIAMAPDRTGPYTLKIRNQYLWDGDLEAVRSILEEMPSRHDTRTIWFRAFHELLEGNPDRTIKQLEPHRGDTYQTHAQTIPLVLVIAWAHEQAGETEPASTAYTEALATLEQALTARPGDFRILMALGLVHAGLGNREQAVQLADEAVEIYPISKDAWAGPIVARNRALVLTRAGELEAALDQIAELLSSPNPGASPSLLRIDPRLANLHSNPRFDAILAQAPRIGLQRGRGPQPK
jgi:TolB-like protein/Flp pilus assembly protein TadD